MDEVFSDKWNDAQKSVVLTYQTRLDPSLQRFEYATMYEALNHIEKVAGNRRKDKTFWIVFPTTKIIKHGVKS